MDHQQAPYQPNGYGSPEGGEGGPRPPEGHPHQQSHGHQPMHEQHPSHEQHHQVYQDGGFTHQAVEPAWKPLPPEPAQPAYHQPPGAQQPPTHAASLTQAGTGSDEPVPVVKVLSVRGVEYLMMSIALWVGAFTFVGLILSLINGGTGFDVLAFPISALVVSVGIFAFFFLRLKKLELQNPRLRFDPSKRRLSQITQVLAYLAVFVSLIGVLYSIIAKVGGSLNTSLWKIVLDFLIVLAVAGGILYYYWRDEHRG